MSINQLEVLRIIREEGPMTSLDIAEHFYNSRTPPIRVRQTCATRCSKLRDCGLIECVGAVAIGHNQANVWKAVEVTE